ncbi:MAG: alpha/beta hydrolase family esterase [Myxococcota bacterium]
MLLALACVAPEDASLDDTAGTAGTVAGPAPLAEISDGQCPDLSVNTSTFSSGGVEREVRVIVPEGDTAGMPLVFVWHPLGATARQMVQWLGLVDWAEQVGAVVVVPSAREDNLFEWDFWNDDAYDVTLFDDVRTCLADELDVDLWRVSATGMSAGGLWTTELAMARADALSTVAIMSGGLMEGYLEYTTPARPLPVLAMHGGESDTYDAGGIVLHFDEQTEDLVEGLVADGSFVVVCDHGLGHTIPSDGVDTLAAWLPTHVWGEPSPFLDGLDGLPDYCAPFP